MRPIDERCDTASRVSPWSWIFPSRVEASNIQGDPRDSAALAASARAGLLDLVPASQRASPLLSFAKPHVWGGPTKRT
jgi:hypothetical protein